MFDFDSGMEKFLGTKVPVYTPTIEDKINGKTMILILQDHSLVWIENDFGSVSTDYYPSILKYDSEHHNFKLFSNMSNLKLGRFIRNNFPDVKEVYLVENYKSRLI